MFIQTEATAQAVEIQEGPTSPASPALDSLLLCHLVSPHNALEQALNKIQVKCTEATGKQFFTNKIGLS